MDNNFNQQQTQGQPVYQQQAQSQPVYQQAPKQPSNINVMELVAIICSAVGLFMSVIGTLLYCSCSASASFETGSEGYTNSAVMIVAILGALIAIGGVVCAILAIKKNGEKKSKMSYIAAAVGVFAILYGIIPTLTICGYNCSLNNAVEDYEEAQETMDYSNMFGF